MLGYPVCYDEWFAAGTERSRAEHRVARPAGQPAWTAHTQAALLEGTWHKLRFMRRLVCRKAIVITVTLQRLILWQALDITDTIRYYVTAKMPAGA